MGRNFVSGLLCTLTAKKPKIPTNSPSKKPRFCQLWRKLVETHGAELIKACVNG